MHNIYDFTINDFENYFIEKKEKKYRATQIFEYLYKKRIEDLNEINNIKLELLNTIKTDFTIKKIKIKKKQEDKDLIKYLFELEDKNKIEAVLMTHDYGISLCVSTQVGCNMNCLFCESGKTKKVRDLKPSEMVLQILEIEKDIKKRISHIVLMGIGEPFDNYDNVLKFIRIINDPKGIAIGARHITLSTCGIIPKIQQLIEENIQINLAISLHSSSNKTRSKLMPINKIYNIKELIDNIKIYISKTNRRVTFEYVMLKNINDSESDAMELSKLIKGINCYVNLIPYNETSTIDLKRSDNENIMKFFDILKKQKINVTIRKEFGTKVSAACGQLRAES